MSSGIWNRIGIIGVHRTQTADQKRNLIVFNKMVTLFWLSISAVYVVILALFQEYIELGLYFILPFTILCLLTLLLNFIGWWTISFVLFLLTLFTISFLDNLISGITPLYPYIAYNTHLLMAFVASQIAVVVGKNSKVLLSSLSIILGLFFFFDYTIIQALWGEELEEITYKNYMFFKLAFVLLFLSIFIFTQMMRSVITSLLNDVDTMRSALDKSKELLEGELSSSEDGPAE